MADAKDYIDKKVHENFSLIDAKLKNSFQAIKADIRGIKSSLNERHEIPRKEVDKTSQKIDLEMEKRMRELKGYFEQSVSGFKKEIAGTLAKASPSKPEIEKLKEEIRREEAGEKARIERDFQRTVGELKKIKAASRLKEPKLKPLELFKKERKFFFTLLFSGFLLLSIIGIFKNPFYFPGLANRAFWGLIIVAAIASLYYLDFLGIRKLFSSASRKIIKEAPKKIKSEKRHSPKSQAGNKTRKRMIGKKAIKRLSSLFFIEDGKKR